MSRDILKLVTLTFLANALILLGYAFINARIGPRLFASFYQMTSITQRTIIMTVLIAVPVNYIFAACYRMVSPGAASMAQLATLVVAMVLNVLLLGGDISSRAWGAAMITLLSAMWFGYELST